MARITINDIAREAGVSKATVSRVINKPEVVDQATREKVQQVIRDRKYIPSATARNLSLQKSDSIAIVVPELDNPFFGGITRSATDALDNLDLSVVFFNTDNDPKKDKKVLRLLRSIKPAGILYTPASDYSEPGESAEINELLRELEIPVVVLDRPAEALDSYDSVVFDDYQGMYDATQSLLQAGHRRIAIINGDLRMVHSRIRQKGYKDALAHAGVPFDLSLCYFGQYKEAEGYKLGKELFASQNLPTAVITCNNVLSLGFLRAAFETHIQISKDIDCIGLDRISALEVLTDGFNYIRRDPAIMGREAVRLLKRRMDNADADRDSVLIDAPVVVKELRHM